MLEAEFRLAMFLHQNVADLALLDYADVKVLSERLSGYQAERKKQLDAMRRKRRH